MEHKTYGRRLLWFMVKKKVLLKIELIRSKEKKGNYNRGKILIKKGKEKNNILNFVYSGNLETMLLTAIDTILKKNKIDLPSLKISLPNFADQDLSGQIVLAVIKGLKA